MKFTFELCNNNTFISVTDDVSRQLTETFVDSIFEMNMIISYCKFDLPFCNSKPLRTSPAINQMVLKIKDN